MKAKNIIKTAVAISATAIICMSIYADVVRTSPEMNSDPEATPFVITFESMEPPASPGYAVCEECQYRPDTADPLVPVGP